MELENWIDQLKKEICPEEDQTLFAEATGCLSSGFYRSGYVISWVAIVESLKKKIFEASSLGDKQAEVSYKKIEGAESKKLSVDKIILEEAIELKIIEIEEESKLSFLWQQRCIFAHPYSKAPDETDLRHIINALVDICLSKPLLYKQRYIDELSENIITKPFFLPENTEEIKSFARKTIARVPQKLHPYFFKTFLFKLGTIINDDTKFSAQLKIRHFLVELFKITDLDLKISDWTLENKVTSYPYECVLGFTHWEIWGKFPDRIKDLLLQYSITESDENKQVNIRQIIGLLLKNIELESKYKELFLKQLDSLEFRRVCNFYGNNALLYDRVLKEFNSHMYTRQNSVIDFFREQNGSTFLSELDQERQITMGWHIMLSNLSNSWTAQGYLSDLSKLKDTALGIKIGLLYGSIITSKNFIFIKKDNLKKVLNLIDKLSEKEISFAFDYIIDKIKVEGEFNSIKESEIDFLDIERELKEITVQKLVELKLELTKYCVKYPTDISNG